MKRILRLDALLIFAVLVMASVVALFSQTDPGAGYPTIGQNLEPLRAAFNANPGNVRAVLLASPT